MDVFKRYFTYDCISFTLIIVLNSLLNIDQLFSGTMSGISWRDLLILFAATSLVELLMYFTDKLPLASAPLIVLIDLLDIAVVIYPTCLLFDMFPFTWGNVILIGVLIVLVYAGVFAVSMIKAREDVKAINRKLKRTRREQRQGGAEK